MESYTEMETGISLIQHLPSKKVLFVGGGRRVSLAKKFIERGYVVYSYETSETAPIQDVASIVVGLSWNDPNIFLDIIAKANFYDCNLIIPLQDAAIPICAMIKDTLKDNNVILCSDKVTAITCFDKKKFESFMLQNFRQFYPLDNGTYPKIMKPRYGFGSRGLITIFNEDDEHTFFANPDTRDDYIIQEFQIGKEYSVDCYFDKKSSWVDSVPRERIRIAGGEVITTKTTRDNDLILLSAAIGSIMHLVGPANMQFIIPSTSQVPQIIEVNARFGGGYTLAMEAGLDVISLIERDYFGKEFEYHAGDWKENLLMERSYRDHFFQE